MKALDSDRFTVWHYSWTRGVPTPMHFHDKDVVVAYRYDGTLKSVTPDGARVVNPYKAGDIRFNKANRFHYEELTTDRQSALIMELKWWESLRGRVLDSDKSLSKVRAL